ncbi:phage tail tube protein [Erythrobacter tepidarius]|nr:phage tail tube protein [Erythrobacter tepidarius]
MPKLRAYGADATLKIARETSYGVMPSSGWRSLDFRSTDLAATQPLAADPLLGRGRNAQDPYRGLVTDEGQIDVPLDLRGTGYWLTALFGLPTTSSVAASGSITFAANPAAGQTITLNGVVWTFVTGTPGALQTQIQATVTQTIDQLVTNLNASANPEISKCTYSRPASTQRLEIVFDTAGPSGNAFTIAASHASPSGPRLTGGGHEHLWQSGADEIPSHTIEIGHPKLTTPVFFRHLGTMAESIEFELGQDGPANARLQLVAQGEERVDPATGARDVRLSLADAAVDAPSGLTVTVNLVIEQRESAISVPRSAIIQSGGEARVRVVPADGIVIERAISFVDWPAESVIVTSGLQAGEHILADPDTAQPGEQVKVRTAPQG